MGKKFKRFSLRKCASAQWRYCVKCGRCLKVGEAYYTHDGEMVCYKCKEEFRR